MNRPLALVALAAALLAMPALAAPAADGFRIRYAERLATSTKPAADGAWQFSAQGKTWSARLKPNGTLLAQVKTAVPLAALPAVWKGQLDGLPGSWVRLTEGTTGTWGTVWDGSDLYFIEPAADAAPFLIDAGATQGSVVYRASDTQLDPTVKLCPVAVIPPNSRLAALAGVDTPLRTAPATKTGLDSYRTLMAEIAPPTAAATLTGRLRVSLVADFEYQQRFGTTGATDRMIARFNTIDGIFSGQVGVQIEVASVRIFDVIDDPFTSSVSGTLLTELANWRANASQAALRADSGITHLVTGRDLDGTTVGIAYVGALCSNNFGAGLSEGDSSTRSNLTSTLIAAHELGHNFGAPHDGEASTTGTANPCESEPQTFLMAPRLNGSSTFSQCSLNQIAPEVASARCLLAPTVGADLRLTTGPTRTSAIVGYAESVQARITNLSAFTATTATLDVTLPAGITGTGSSAAASCSNASPTLLRCVASDIASGAIVNVNLELTPTAVGSPVVQMQLSGVSDPDPNNNTINYTIEAVEGVDLVGTLTSPAASTGLRVAGGSTAEFSVRNASAIDATDVTIAFLTNVGMLTRGEATMPTATCTTNNRGATCTLARLAAGATVTGTIGIDAEAAGAQVLTLSAAAAEPDPSRVVVNLTINVTEATTPPTPPPASGSGGGGGGGAMDPLALSALALLAVLAMAGRRGAPRRARARSRAPREPRAHRLD